MFLIELMSLSEVPTLPGVLINLSATNCNCGGMINFIPLRAIINPLSFERGLFQSNLLPKMSIRKNKYATKAKVHKKECPAIWIFQDWKPQKLEALKFIKS